MNLIIYFLQSHLGPQLQSLPHLHSFLQLHLGEHVQSTPHLQHAFLSLTLIVNIFVLSPYNENLTFPICFTVIKPLISVVCTDEGLYVYLWKYLSVSFKRRIVLSLKNGLFRVYSLFVNCEIFTICRKTIFIG